MTALAASSASLFENKKPLRKGGASYLKEPVMACAPAILHPSGAPDGLSAIRNPRVEPRITFARLMQVPSELPAASRLPVTHLLPARASILARPADLLLNPAAILRTAAERTESLQICSPADTEPCDPVSTFDRLLPRRLFRHGSNLSSAITDPVALSVTRNF